MSSSTFRARYSAPGFTRLPLAGPLGSRSLPLAASLGSRSHLIVHLIACLSTLQGLLSDPNMDAFYLGILVMVGCNKSKFKPPLKAIKERYYSKFRGKGGEHEEPTA